VVAPHLGVGSGYAGAVHACAATMAALFAAVTLVAAALLFGRRTERRPDPTFAPLSPTPIRPPHHKDTMITTTHILKETS